MRMEYTDAINLISGIVEQADRDAYTSKATQPYHCEVCRYRPPRSCAKDFLERINANKDKTRSPTEWALTIMDVIG